MAARGANGYSQTRAMKPPRTMKYKPGLPRMFDRPKYRQRNIIEGMFGWLKENSRIMTRLNKLTKSYAAIASLACSILCLLHLFLVEPNARLASTTVSVKRCTTTLHTASERPIAFYDFRIPFL